MTKAPIPPGTRSPGAPTTSAAGGASAPPRAQRLAVALRANLRRRKVQKQERARAAEADHTEGEASADGSSKES